MSFQYIVTGTTSFLCKKLCMRKLGSIFKKITDCSFTISQINFASNIE